MFWHGLSLVSSRVKRDFVESMVFQRERNIGQSDFVLGWWQTSQEHGLQLSLETKWCLCFAQAVGSLWVKLCSLKVKPVFLWKPFFFFFFKVGQLIFLAIRYTMRPHKVGEVDRFAFLRFLLRCCVVLVRWFRERCLLAAVCPLTPSLSWHPLVHPLIFLSIHLCSKRVLPLTGWMSPEFL